MTPKQVAERFANNVRRLMNAQHVTQAGLAGMAKMSEPSVSRLLSASHSPSGPMLAKIATALSVDIHELFRPTGHVELKPNGRKSS